MKCDDRDRVLRIMEALGLANRLVALGRLDEAFEALGALEATPEEAPGAIYLQASLAAWAGRWSDAIPLLEGLLRVAPEQAEIRLGDARLRAIPEAGAIRLELARCLIESGRPDEARRAIETVGPPPGGDGPVLLAWIAAKQGQPDLAFLRLGAARRPDSDARSAALVGYPELATLLGSAPRN